MFPICSNDEQIALLPLDKSRLTLLVFRVRQYAPIAAPPLHPIDAKQLTASHDGDSDASSPVEDSDASSGRVGAMKVKFVLTMDDVVLNDRTIDQVILDWVSDIDQQEIMEVSHSWITTQNFLTRRMVGLSRVGESSLTIEPLEEETDAPF